MGRTKSFVTADVVRAARDVFWRQGYDEASIPQLRAATGLSASSLYHAFGSKRGLFDEALTNYLDEVALPRLIALRQERPAPWALADYLLGVRRELTDPGSRLPLDGCLALRSASGSLAADPALRARIVRYRGQLFAAMLAGVRARRPEFDDAEAERLASTVTNLVISAFTLSRVDGAGAVESIDTALALLEPRSAEH